MVRVRSFIAIEPSDVVRNACREVMTAMSRQSEGVRWVHPSNLHMTVKFLGEIDDREIPMVCRYAQDAAAQTPRFSVACGTVGAFPAVTKPNTIWAGIQDQQQALSRLHQRVADALDPLGFRREHRHFKAHLTLGRVKARPAERASLAKVIEQHMQTDFGIMPVTELIVYSSELAAAGPHYTVLSRCPLRA